MEKTIHQGRNIKRFREMLGIKQDALASDIGDEWNQQRISLLEQKEYIDPGILDQVSKALKVPIDAIRNFDEEAAISYINNFNDNSINNAANFQFKCNFNPFDKLIEAMEENKQLYERLLQCEKEKVQNLQQFISLQHNGNSGTYA